MCNKLKVLHHGCTAVCMWNIHNRVTNANELDWVLECFVKMEIRRVPSARILAAVPGWFGTSNPSVF